ncbi:hypothetical protein [Pedobacter boryungensis]|uniref:Uncharacterized protein n=1 Tax=Pedobacter boryungensis TaxID=869962 RepID=A0ABX2DEU9_9SPHI|nr:hypothetical protein [Pedobacter boryungensis]NQX32609.1 hypothetical protein [Pedobacter boryungensis]
MNNKNYLIALICFVLFGCNSNQSSQSISVKKTEAAYNFEASYPEKKTAKVISYIESTIKDDLFSTVNSKHNAEVLLNDSTKFYLKAEPGFIIIDFKKQKNSITSYQKLEKLCMGIKEVISEN